MAKVTSELAPWQLRILEFDFDIIHRMGIRNKITDEPLGPQTFGVDLPPWEDEMPVFTIFPTARESLSLTAEHDLRTIEKSNGFFTLYNPEVILWQMLPVIARRFTDNYQIHNGIGRGL